MPNWSGNAAKGTSWSSRCGEPPSATRSTVRWRTRSTPRSTSSTTTTRCGWESSPARPTCFRQEAISRPVGTTSRERGGEYGLIRRVRRKPLIAAVEGPALGGGLELVLACDLVVASQTARFGLPEVCIGVVPTCAGLFRAPRALPLNVARQLILTGRPIDAQRGYEAGFVNVADRSGRRARGRRPPGPGHLLQRAGLGPGLPRRSERTHRRSRRVRLEPHRARARRRPTRSADAREGVAAFLEKRPPVWTGR